MPPVGEQGGRGGCEIPIESETFGLSISRFQVVLPFQLGQLSPQVSSLRPRAIGRVVCTSSINVPTKYPR